jgi:hypothetical protein
MADVVPVEIDYSDVLHLGTQHNSIVPKGKSIDMLLVIFKRLFKS